MGLTADKLPPFTDDALLVDSHAHLDQCGDPDETLAEANAQGVGHILSVGFDLDTSKSAVEIARGREGVQASVGIHPNEAAAAAADVMTELTSLATDPQVAAIGETGLDFYRDRTPRDIQEEFFIRHIALARELDLTLVVHTREAGEETLRVLLEHAKGLRVILHCFSLYEDVDLCAERGYFMSLAGNVTFLRAESLRVAAARIPAHLLLTETDCPWLAPVPYRGKQNRPSYIPLILSEIASLRRTDPSELAAQVLQNYMAALPPKA